MADSPKIGIALGGGSARGWAHIGVLKWLHENGIEPDVVCGTSIGALVGGAEAAGNLMRLHDWVLELEWRDVIMYLDVGLSGGLIRGSKLFAFLRAHFQDRMIEELPRAFGAVATRLTSGQEMWLREGSLLDAIRASIAVPGLFTPGYRDVSQEWLVDGGLVNPVPVSLCRALGADRVIAVDLNTNILQRFDQQLAELAAGEEIGIFTETDWKTSLGMTLREKAQQLRSRFTRNKEGAPSMVDVVMQSLYIMQVRITRARLAGDPPDILLTPRVGHIHLMEFHRASEAIEEGYSCAEESAAILKRVARNS